MPDHISRRTFTRAATMGAALSALPSLGAARAPLPSAPSSIRLGIASYTFRNFDTAHLIAFAKQLHVTDLNLKDMHLPFTPADQVATRAAAFRSAGFTLTAAGNITFATLDEADIRSKFDYCRNAGIPVMVCAPTREVLPALDKYVKEYDIRLAIHNHGPEDKQFPSPLDVLKAVQSLDPRIGCCIDVGHTMRSGTDVVEAIHRAGPRLFDVHMKDLADRTSKESQVAVGEGVMPVPAIFQALLDIHYPGYVDLEYEIVPDDPMPGVLESFAYMRGVLAGMGRKV